MPKHYQIKRTRVGGQSAAERTLRVRSWPFVITEAGNVAKTVAAIATDGLPPVHPQARQLAEKLVRLLNKGELEDGKD